MLKWIIMLIPLLGGVVGIVSLRSAKRENDKMNLRFADANKNLRLAEEEIPRVREERDTSYKLVEELKASKKILRTNLNVSQQIVDNGGDYRICLCRNCRVLRANDHGYAKRMRGAIRRDIEAESA